MNSIRNRLLLSIGLSITVILAVSFALVYSYTARSLRKNFDNELAQKTRAFALMAELEANPNEDQDTEPYEDFGDDAEDLVHFEFAELPIPEYEPGASQEYYQVWDAAGVVLARSPSLAKSNLPRTTSALGRVNFLNILLPDARPGRLAVIDFVPAADDGGDHSLADATTLTLAISRSTESLYDVLHVLLVGLSTSALATMAILGLFVWAAIRRAVLPLDEVCRELTLVSADDLGHSFSTSDRPLELKPVCDRLNELLARLQNSFERERRFTSDVAHELRTPIAELRALADVSVRRESAGPAERRSFEDARDIAQGMERVVTALLEITRCDSGLTHTQKEPLRLSDAFGAAWAPFEHDAREKQLVVRLDCENVSCLNTDPVLFGTILANMFSNAVAYTPAGGSIRLTLQNCHGSVDVCLVNDTDLLDPSDLEHIYDTFWRKHGQDTESRHSGVGLSLVKALARVLGATVQCDLPATGLFQIVLRHPV